MLFFFSSFVLKLFKMTANQSNLDLNRGLSPSFCGLRSANDVKFSELCMMWLKKQVLVKRIKIRIKNLNF